MSQTGCRLFYLSKMITELIKFNDPDLKEFLKLCYDEMNYSDDGIGFEFLHGMISRAYENNNAIGLLHKDENKINGAVVCLVSDGIKDSASFAIEQIWHSDPRLTPIKRAKIMLKLLTNIKVKLRDQGVKFLHIDTSTKFPSIAKMLERDKFGLKELHWVGEL